MTAPASPTPGRPSVLLVDDEPALLELMQLGLETEFDVEVAGSTEEASMLLETGAHNVVVCDHLMPRGNGLDFLIEVSRRHPAVRRILVTGYMNPEFLSRTTSLARLSACLMKPVHNAEMIAVIRRALAEKG